MDRVSLCRKALDTWEWTCECGEASDGTMTAEEVRQDAVEHQRTHSNGTGHWSE